MSVQREAEQRQIALLKEELERARYQVTRLEEAHQAQASALKDLHGLQSGSIAIEQVLDDGYIASRINPSRKHVWLVAAPKSGSTWLTVMLSELLGWPTDNLVTDYGRREQEIDFRKMLLHTGEDLFSVQQHCRLSAATRRFIEQFRVRVIFQGRNLFDALVSFRDHLVREDTLVPEGYVDETFRLLDPQQQLDYVVDVIGPWYLNFYATWFAGKAREPNLYHWVSYDQLLADPAGVLRGVINDIGVDRSQEEIAAALQRAAGRPTRLNSGRTGRGEELLSAAQKDRVRKLREYFTQVDFSPIGL